MSRFRSFSLCLSKLSAPLPYVGEDVCVGLSFSRDCGDVPPSPHVRLIRLDKLQSTKIGGQSTTMGVPFEALLPYGIILVVRSAIAIRV